MSGVCVQPPALMREAACADGTADLVAAVARAVGALEVPTGEPRTAQAAAEVVAQLSGAIRLLAQEMAWGAAATRDAARRYRQVDGRAVGGP